MKNGKNPNPNTIHPIAGYDKEIYVKPTIKNPNIIVGDFTYIADSEFESHVTHHYEWNGDKLIIGKFCQIAAGVEFVMNGANHQMNAVSTFPFYTLEGWNMNAPAMADMPLKGDTIIGNDVWIGQNAVVLPGVHIEYGAIIGANSVSLTGEQNKGNIHIDHISTDSGKQSFIKFSGNHLFIYYDLMLTGNLPGNFHA